MNTRLTDTKQFINGAANDRFVERGLSYDRNGNIQTLQRTELGVAKTNTYTYSGNQLTSLSGAVTGTYAYDANGNMTHDGPNNLDLSYNHLNLIEKVQRGGTTVAKYSYLSDGTKLAATDAAGNGLLYLGSLEYKTQGDNTLSLNGGNFTDGRFVATSSGIELNYFLTDHLGSVRALIDPDGNVIERNDYYAFGKRWDDASSQISSNRHRYNGKEEQAFLNVPYINYGFRMYDPNYSIRWNGMDKLAEMTPGVTPFAFCNNNPIRFVDHFGLMARDTLSIVNIEPVIITGKSPENNTTYMPVYMSMISFGVTTNYEYMNDFAKNGLYLGSYNGINKGYSNQFYGNKQISKTTVIAQKARFNKILNSLTKLKKTFTALGAIDVVTKLDKVYTKYVSEGEVNVEDVYSLVSAATGLAGLQGAILSITMDLSQLSTNNAIKYYEATGNEELFIKWIQPGPRPF